MANIQDISIQKEIFIECSPKEIFNYWRNFDNLPQILDFLENMLVLDQTHSRWTAKIYSDMDEKEIWDVEITRERKSSLIEWHSEQNPDLLHEGAVRFASVNSGTKLQLNLRFFFPPLHDSHPDMLGNDFENRIEEDLRRFKLAVEAGEFPKKRSGKSELPEGYSESPGSYRDFQ
jgi:uncharacterized membrane protein